MVTVITTSAPTTVGEATATRITCAAACRYADLDQELCLKDHITIGYGKPSGSDWPCRDFEQVKVSPAEFEEYLIAASRRHRTQQVLACDSSQCS
jgi:hypothetical protein